MIPYAEVGSYLRSYPSKYVGKEDDSDNPAAAVCELLCKDAGLMGQRGLVLYTDNYYTYVKLLRLMFEKY